MSYRIEVIDNLDGAIAIEDSWRMLAEEVAEDPFTSPDWLIPWWQAFGQVSRMHLLIAWDGSRLVGFAPLRIVDGSGRHASYKVLRHWSNSHSNRISWLLTRDDREDLASALVAEALSDDSWDLAVLGPMMREDSVTTSVYRSFDRRVTTGWRDGLESPVLSLPDTWDVLLASLTPTFVKRLNQQGRRASRNGAQVSFSDDAQQMEDVFAISRRSWQHQQGTAVASSSDTRLFYEGVATRMARRGRLELGFLSIGEELAAFELKVLWRGWTYNLKREFVQAHRSHSPGSVLKAAALKRAIDRGDVACDFLGASEPHKLNWTEVVRPHGAIVVARRGTWLRLRHWVEFGAAGWFRRSMPWAKPLVRRVRRCWKRVVVA